MTPLIASFALVAAFQGQVRPVCEARNKVVSRLMAMEFKRARAENEAQMKELDRNLEKSRRDLKMNREDLRQAQQRVAAAAALLPPKSHVEKLQSELDAIVYGKVFMKGVTDPLIGLKNQAAAKLEAAEKKRDEEGKKFLAIESVYGFNSPEFERQFFVDLHSHHDHIKAIGTVQGVNMASAILEKQAAEQRRRRENLECVLFILRQRLAGKVVR